MQIILNLIWVYICWYLRPFIKWFLHKTTRLCELQRICYGAKAGAPRSSQFELSLQKSRTSSIKALMQQLYKLADEGKFHGEEGDHLVNFAVTGIVRIKKINPVIHRDFIECVGLCMDQILGYRQLIFEVERLRKTPYCSENILHEQKLFQLWKLLMPNKPLTSRITKQWSEIGFQGDDPKTDFRGMGLLGLDNLLFFAEEYSGAARHVLSHSHHPLYGYSFAIVGINLTSMAYTLMLQGALKTHFFNYVKGRPDINNFHQVYCYLFYEFDKFWLAEKPKDIMEFNRIRNKFEEAIQTLLQHPETIFKINLSIDTV